MSCVGCVWDSPAEVEAECWWGICPNSILPRDPPATRKNPLSCSTEHRSSPLLESHSSHSSSAILASFGVTLKPASCSPEKWKIWRMWIRWAVCSPAGWPAETSSKWGARGERHGGKNLWNPRCERRSRSWRTTQQPSLEFGVWMAANWKAFQGGALVAPSGTRF